MQNLTTSHPRRRIVHQPSFQPHNLLSQRLNLQSRLPLLRCVLRLELFHLVIILLLLGLPYCRLSCSHRFLNLSHQSCALIDKFLISKVSFFNNFDHVNTIVDHWCDRKDIRDGCVVEITEAHVLVKELVVSYRFCDKKLVHDHLVLGYTLWVNMRIEPTRRIIGIPFVKFEGFYLKRG